MDEFPSISVIIPSYNQGQFIERTLLSILKQDYPGKVQVIVSDGGSTDETVEILKRYDSRIIWWSQKDKGFVDAVNKGLAKAKGEIVAIQSSDDYYLKNAFRHVAKGFQGFPDASFVVGGALHIDLHDYVRSFDVCDGTITPRSILFSNYVPQSSAFVKSEYTNAAGGLRGAVDLCSDWDFWYRISNLCPGAYLPQILSVYQIHPNQRTRSQLPWFESVKRMVETCESDSQNPIYPFLDEREREDLYAYWDLLFTNLVDPLNAQRQAVIYYARFYSFSERTRKEILRHLLVNVSAPKKEYEPPETWHRLYRRATQPVIRSLRSLHASLSGVQAEAGQKTDEGSVAPIPELDIHWWKGN